MSENAVGLKEEYTEERRRFKGRIFRKNSVQEEENIQNKNKNIFAEQQPQLGTTEVKPIKYVNDNCFQRFEKI